MESLPEYLADSKRSDIDHINRALGNLGLYDASQDTYPTTDHDDESWFIRGLE